MAYLGFVIFIVVVAVLWAGVSLLKTGLTAIVSSLLGGAGGDGFQSGSSRPGPDLLCAHCSPRIHQGSLPCRICQRHTESTFYHVCRTCAEQFQFCQSCARKQ